MLDIWGGSPDVKVEIEWKVIMPLKRSSPIIKHRSGELRKEPTAAEAKLWRFLRALKEEGIHFRRQHAIGPYIADFAAPRRKLLIELDGSPHVEQQDYDIERTAFLKGKGYHILRFWNYDVMNKFNDVLGAIREELDRSSP
jgi:very-short-patch-repair endonuclease